MMLRYKDSVTHPLVLAAMGTLLLNDHVLKHSYPSWLTGKLSDLAGLLFFPIVLDALVAILLPKRALVRLSVCTIATGIAFALVKTWRPVAEFYGLALGALQWPYRALVAMFRGIPLPELVRVHTVSDLSDLIALPSLALAYWIGRRRANVRQGECATPKRCHVSTTDHQIIDGAGRIETAERSL